METLNSEPIRNEKPAQSVILHYNNLYKNFLNNRNKHSHIWYRWFNEVPVVALILIVVLVVYKPFI